jgi:hypothetical protein
MFIRKTVNSLGDFGALITTMKKAATEAVEASYPVAVTFGVVIGTDPLQISTEQKETFTASQLVLTAGVKDVSIDMTVDHETEPETDHVHSYYDSDTGQGASGSTTRNTSPTSHLHAYTGQKSFLVHRGLKVGDSVILLRMQGGQKYIVFR